MAKFEDLVSKAGSKNKVTRPDYVLEIDGDTYRIAYPDAQAYLSMSTLDEKETLEQLKIIFRKQPIAFNALMRALDGEDVEVIDLLLSDMFNVWNDDSIKQPGKSRG